MMETIDRKAQMRVKPILFNTDMVRAILDGRKTVTRRVVCPQPPRTCTACCYIGADYEYDETAKSVYCAACGEPRRDITAPYRPGDILYVREAFAPNYFSKEIADFYNNGNRTAYRADFDSGKIGDAVPEPKWRPSIHMPREAARIWLRVTDVRVERLQEVNFFDCINEGIPYNQFESEIIKDFSEVWDSTVKPADRERYGWAANPWVWVIAFERCGKLEGWPT